MPNRNKVLAWTALALSAGQVAITLASWLLTAAWPENYTRSLLSAEGIRWFFGHFQDNLPSPVLIWLLVGSVAYGAFCGSGLRHYSRTEYRQRFAMRVACFVLVVLVLVMLALTLLPHALLLNVMGGLMPSSFSRAIIPYCSFAVMAVSACYGLLSGNMTGVEGVFGALCCGVARCAPLYVLYVLAAQLFCSVEYLLLD